MADNNRGNGNNHRNGNFRPGRKEKPKWTIMVYLGGDNNLTPNCISVLQQLEAVEYSKDVCVLACFDSNTPWPKGSRYLAINCRRRSVRNCIDWEIHNDLIPPNDREHDFRPPDFCADAQSPKAPPLKRTGVAEGLKRFLSWSMKNHDSERYMLILYGHGPLVAGQTFLVRENPHSSLLFEDLQKVLAPHFNPRSKLDILACQNCVMNGLETAYEVRDQVDVMIGSQGLVLADGWPYEKIISAIVEKPDAPTREISVKLLKACARNLIDFAVMDRSSEQSACNLRPLGEPGNITTAISEFVETMKKALDFETINGQTLLKYPTIVDAVRLARLEAQSYWGERFVDLYDFCERLLKKCNEAVRAHNTVLKQLGPRDKLQRRFCATPLVQLLKETISHCISLMGKCKELVIGSYYIGPDLQYSHGFSVFFPWTLPDDPYTFVETGDEHILKTAFETYSEYKFVKESQWADFLRVFFKATLRRVRRADRTFGLHPNTASLNVGLVYENFDPVEEVLTGDLQKSGSSTGYVDHEVWSYVKNYPRRNYLSPVDCPRKISTSGVQRPGTQQFPTKTSPAVSYLGWNISGIVREVIASRSKACRNGRSKSVVQPNPGDIVLLHDSRRPRAKSRR